MRGVGDFFSVARTMPLLALMPSAVTPWLTALRAYSVGWGMDRKLWGVIEKQSREKVGLRTYLYELATAEKLVKGFVRGS